MCYSRFRTSRLSRQLPEAGMFNHYTTQPVFLPCVQYVAVHCDNFKFKTVLSSCDLAYSFDRFRDCSDQLGL